jgi:hypothetical protein
MASFAATVVLLGFALAAISGVWILSFTRLFNRS